jgi:hypothetical protein
MEWSGEDCGGRAWLGLNAGRALRLGCQGVWERCESVCTAGSSAVPRLRSVCMAVPRGGPHIGGDDGIPGARGALTSWEGCERVWFE